MYVYPLTTTSERCCSVIYTVRIKDRQERIQFAIELAKLLKNKKTFIPGRTNKLIASDIGIRSVVDMDTLARVEALIDRRGYEVIKTEKPSVN
tara:strand:- start:55 stop:333 length:279 start_codon:yes stop_codon:yes gene_type:complete